MLLKKSSKLFSKFSTQPSSLQWRHKIKRNQIISAVSSVLLQRQNWVPFLQKLNLSSKLTQEMFLQILLKTQKDPQTTLSFFNWARSNLHFQPLLKTQYRIILILINSGLLQPAESLLDSIIQSESATSVIDSTMGACQEDRDSQSVVSSFLLEFYSKKGLIFGGLEIFRKIKAYKLDPPSVNCCNVLLRALQQMGEVKIARCFCASIVRYGVSMNSSTWALVVRLLCEEGKLENALKLVNSGIYSSSMYNLIIESCCRKGNFKTAIDLLNDMESMNLAPGFKTYSLILDGACKYKEEGCEVTEKIIRDMAAKELLPASSSSPSLLDYNLIIQKLCESSKTNAAKMFFWQALREKIGVLRDSSYCFMLRALSKEGRGKEAMEVYKLIQDQGITIKNNSTFAFAKAICEEGPSKEVEIILKDLISKGFIPGGSDLSKFVTAQCNQRRWKEAEDILNAILDKGFLLDSLCCSLLVEHYCDCKQIDLGLELHEKTQKLGGNLDVKTYNVLLVGLFKARKIEEASRVFDYMRTQKLANTTSYSIMITGLSCHNEMRRAMEIHDEMLKMELKPDKAVYKRLISKFS